MQLTQLQNRSFQKIKKLRTLKKIHSRYKVLHEINVDFIALKSLSTMYNPDFEYQLRKNRLKFAKLNNSNKLLNSYTTADAGIRTKDRKNYGFYS